jgi:hypothetical protein
MAGESESNGTPETPVNGQEETPAPVTLDAFAEYVSKIDAKMGDMGRQLARLGAKSPDPKAKPAPETKPAAEGSPPGLTQDDIAAAMRFAEIKGRLPEQARARLDGMLSNGVSYSEAATVAEMLAETLKEAGGGGNADTKPSQPTIQGKSGTPAPTYPGPTIQRWGEYLKLRKADPKKAAAWWDTQTPEDIQRLQSQ